MVTHLQLLYLVTDLFDHPGKLVAKRHAGTGVRHGAVVQVKTGAANARSRDPHDGVLRVQDTRHGFLVDADPQGPR